MTGVPAAAPRRGFGVWLRRLAWAVSALLTLWALAWLAMPPLLKSQAEKRLGAALGRPVAIGAVEFLPWTLELTLRDVVIGGIPTTNTATTAGAAAQSGLDVPPLLRLARLHVDADARSLWQRAPVIAALDIDGLDIHLARTAPGHYDIDDLLARFAPSPDAAPAGEPLRFALYNIALRDASVHVEDRPLRRRHEVTALQFTLPFLSNLPAQVAVTVEPRLAFRFNGSAFDSGAQATPFAQTRSARFQLKLAPLDLAPYLGYLPESLPLRLTRGSVHADLAIDVTQPPDAVPTLALRGTLGADDMAWHWPASTVALPAGGAVTAVAAARPALEWRHLALELRDVQPLLRRVALGALTVDAPQLRVARDARGRIDWLVLAAAPAAPASASASAPLPSSSPAPWQIKLDSLALQAMQVHWNDAAVKPAAALVLGDIALKAGPLTTPFSAPLPLHLAARLSRPEAEPVARAANAATATPAVNATPTPTDDDRLGRIDIDARLDAAGRTATLDLKLERFALQALAPYLAPSFTPSVEGALSASGHVELALADATPQLKVSGGKLSLDGVRVLEPPSAGAAPVSKAGAGPAQASALTLKQLSVDGITLDLAARRLGLGQVRLLQPLATLARDGAGQWNVQRWSPPVEAAAPAARTAPASAAASSRSDKAVLAAPWRVELGGFALDGGQLRFSDGFARSAGAGAGGEPVRFALNQVQATVGKLALAGARSLAPAAVRFSARLAAPATEHAAAAAAVVDWRGQVGAEPLLARGALRVERFPVHLFEPYFGRYGRVDLVRAEAGVKAELSVLQMPAGLRVKASGDVLLADVKVDARAGVGSDAGGDAGSDASAAAPAGADPDTADELLSWQRFTLKGVTLALEPGRPPSVAIAEAALDDFYTRLLITEKGRFNLQDVGPGPAGGAAAPASAPAQSQAPAASAASGAASGPDISVGATRLSGGRIDFSDHFVRPNYSARLTELSGSLGAFRSGTREMATLELHGRAAGTALLDISGQLNPTAEPLALDIRARATDLELAPLSPYAGKYVGYAIERGKLSMDVAYKISPDGTLDAKNQVTLNQLTFGDKIDSASATQLPVLLAVALLKDRHGVIDINLPVSGSVNDPKFSVGGIIWKVILNLLGRALTAPFALLSGGAGGSIGDDLSAVDFGPGTARLAASGSAVLDKVAKALADRPSLKMTLTGAADASSEREAFAQAALDARLLAERRKEQQRSGAPVADNAVVAEPPMSAEERGRWLKELYRQTRLPDKPRNLIGLAKDLPPAEMERLLKAQLQPGEEAMRDLALQRGLVVRDALIARGLPSERLFLAAPKLRAAADGAAAWTPRVQLGLQAN